MAGIKLSVAPWQNLPNPHRNWGECDAWLWRDTKSVNYLEEKMVGSGLPFVIRAMKERYDIVWEPGTQEKLNPGEDHNDVCVTPQDGYNHTRCSNFGPVSIACSSIDWSRWTPQCPEALRSASGCGDFAEMDSMRPQACASQLELHTCANTGGPYWGSDPWTMYHSAVIAGHVSTLLQLGYATNPRLPFASVGIPPTIAPHRLLWPRWGRYTFLPIQRWLHHVEHGGMAILYHPCLGSSSACKMEQWASNFDISTMSVQQRWNTSTFRWVMTPYPGLKTKIAIAFYGVLYMRDCYDEAELNGFVHAYYGCTWHACEMGMVGDGDYDYLRMPQGSSSCTAEPLTMQPTLWGSSKSEAHVARSGVLPSLLGIGLLAAASTAFARAASRTATLPVLT
jgi:hypothetical protein